MRKLLFLFLLVFFSCNQTEPSYVIGVQKNFITKVEVNSVYDGDTFRGDLYLGMDITLKNQPFRLAEIDAPELSEKGGYKSRDFLRKKILDKKIFVEIVDERDKYGRILALIYDAYNLCEENVSINNEMIEKSYATPY